MRTRSVKKGLAWLLTLVMVLSMCAVLPLTAKADDEVTYTPAAGLTEGLDCLIVAESAGTKYALSYDGEALGAVAVTEEDGAITLSGKEAVWTPGPDDTIESAGTPGIFIFSGSQGLMVFTGGRTFVYDAAAGNVLMHSLYYLTFDASTNTFNQSTEAGDAAAITLYGREMPKIVREEVYVPDGSDIPCVEKQAVKNEDGSITLMIVTDVHYSTEYDQNNLEVWYGNVIDKIGHIDSFASLGDTGSAYSTTPEIYWDNVKVILDYVDSKVDAGEIGTAVYTFGNHEWYPSAGGDFMNNYENETAVRMKRMGEAVKTDDYIFYCLGSGSIASRFSQGYSDEDIERVDTYLSTAPTDIPIFILTHFPIHFWGDRKEENAAKLLDVFNKYPNVVVFWGHNHSDFDESYDMVYRPGDSITLDENGTTAPINFTYLSGGCISDEEYTGPYGGSAWALGKGLIVTINPDKTLTFDYYTMDGEKLAENGPYYVEFRDGVEYNTLKTEYVEEGGSATAPEVPEYAHYAFTGWDTAFDNITGHTVVTAQYDYLVDRDESNIYITQGSEAVVGKSGAPRILYPIPCSEGMTVADAFTILQQQEYPGDPVPEIATGSRGYFTQYWGTTEEDRIIYANVMNSDNGYLESSSAVLPGNCYYMNVYDDAHEQVSASFIDHEEITVDPGETVSLIAKTFAYRPSRTYWPVAMNGKVFCGPTLDALTDTGVTAADGAFELPFNEAGDYYVVVRQDGAADAYAVVHVAAAEAPAEEPAETPAEPASPDAPSEDAGKAAQKLSTGTIVLIVCLAVIVIALLLYFLLRSRKKNGKEK